MLVHLQEIAILRLLYCTRPKMNRPDGVIPRVPINVRCSIFNDILPIRDWDFHWHRHLNDNGHWLIQTPSQAWAISAENGDVAFFQWSIA